ncbi:MAG: hypothetical protein D6785_00350, partial [Planctomycetota bacterium]
MNQNSKQRASMLIVALGVLTLLSVMAVAFATMMSMEQKASTNFVDGVRANFLAVSGREAASIYLKSTMTDPNILANQNLKNRFPWLYNMGDYSLPLEQAMTAPNPASILSYYGYIGGTYMDDGDKYGVKIIDTSSQFNLNNRFQVTQLSGGKVQDPIYTRILANLG